MNYYLLDILFYFIKLSNVCYYYDVEIVVIETVIMTN